MRIFWAYNILFTQKAAAKSSGMENIMGYDYNMLIKDCNMLVKEYGFCDFYSVSESVMEKKLCCLRVGSGSKKIFVNGAHHGLEYLTSAFIVRFFESYCKAYADNTDFFGYDVKKLYDSVSLYAVPMVNPDGVDIAVNGIDITNPYHRKLISMVGIHSFNKVWQANANGVDINHNYDAGWQAVKTYPSPTGYAGPYSESEPETKAMVELIKTEKFDMLIAFHSQGGEIYYDFDGSVPEKSYELVNKMAQVSGYTPSVPSGTAAYGGCKDWFIKEFSKSGFTVEIGKGKNPLPVEMLDKIFEENAKIILSAMEELM